MLLVKDDTLNTIRSAAQIYPVMHLISIRLIVRYRVTKSLIRLRSVNPKFPLKENMGVYLEFFEIFNSPNKDRKRGLNGES